MKVSGAVCVDKGNGSNFIGAGDYDRKGTGINDYFVHQKILHIYRNKIYFLYAI